MAENDVSRKVLIIVIFLILIVVNGMQFYWNRQNEAKNARESEMREGQLVDTYAKLDSISGQLSSKMEEIELLGGNIDSLLVIKEELEREKEELRLSRNLAQERYNKIRDKIEGYEFLLKRKDQEIANLKETNQELLTENISLKNTQNNLNQEIRALKQEKELISEKINEAAILRAESLRFYAVSSKGKEREGEEFRTNQIEGLRVEFTLRPNPLAEVGSKYILMRIVDPEGSVIFNNASGSGTFKMNGEEFFYTASREILFDNTGQMVRMEYGGSEFRKGRHKVELFADAAMIGSGYFIVR